MQRNFGCYSVGWIFAITNEVGQLCKELSCFCCVFVLDGVVVLVSLTLSLYFQL